MTVTFCGHREIDDHDAVERWLFLCVETLIRDGATVFYLGGYGAFDLMAAAVLRQLKKIHPLIRSVLVLAYRNQKFDAALYDETIYPLPENIPWRHAIPRRNQWMVQHADMLVAYVIRGWGGAARTLDDAQKTHRRILLYPGI